MTSGTISKNSAWKGGGVAIFAGTTFNMSGGLIDANKYGLQGGGVWVWHDDYKTLFNMSGGTISNNSTLGEGYGGGVWTDYYGRIKISGGTISGNSGLTGGGVQLSSYMTETDKDPVILEITGGKITGNTAVSSGGGLNISSRGAAPAQVKISNCEITNNTAGGDGGGLYFYGTQTSYKKTITFSGTVKITGNSGYRGGGIHMYGNDELTTCSGMLVQNNTATNTGGGIYISDYSILNFYGGKVSANKGGSYNFFFSSNT